MPSSPNLMLGSFGKVVGSIEGLRHKLDNLSASDIDDTQEKVKTLNLRLSELQKTLERLSTIRDQVAEVEGAKERFVAEAAHITELERVQTPLLQLHAIGQLRNLILFPRANKAVTDTHNRSSKEPQSTSAARENNELAEQTSSNRLSASDGTDANPTLSPTISNFSGLSVESGAATSAARQKGDEATRQDLFTEKLPETPFRADDRVIAAESESELRMAEPGDKPEVEPVPTQRTKPASQTSDPDPASAPTTEWRENAGSVNSVSSESQITSGFEFDQRLLNDLIKDYGEFVIPSSSPTSAAAEVTEAPKLAQTSSESPMRAEFPVVENVTVRNTLPTGHKEGDLDRRLKKLIKDYGEYDLYSDQTTKKYWAGVVAVLAILGVVVAGIYFLSPSQNEVLTRPSPALRSESRSKSAVGETNKGNAAVGTKAASGSQVVNPEPTDPSGSRGSTNKPRADKNNKNDEKVGKSL